jgi:hypothetical protein
MKSPLFIPLLCLCLSTVSHGSECYHMELPEDPMVTRVVSYLNIRDNTEYEVYEPSASVISTFNEQISQLPELLQTLYEYRVLRVIFIEEYITSGQVLRMRTGDDKEGYLIIMDAAVFDKTLEQWCQDHFEKIIHINPSTGNARLKVSDDDPGYLFVLIHEMFHILDYWAHQDHSLKEVQGYLGMIGDDLWLHQDELKQEYHLSQKLEYLAPTPMELNQAVTLHKEVSQGPLVSLQSFLGKGEDFAEFMTIYCLEYYMDIQFEVEFFNDKEELVYTYSPFSDSESCLDRKFVASFLFTQILNQEG